MTDDQTNNIINKFPQAVCQLYLISAGVNGPIKIGWSRNPKKRLSSIQTGNPKPLIILAAWEGGYDEIRLAEQQFIIDWSAHYDFCGEWFNSTESLMFECMPDFFQSIGLQPVRVI